MAFFLAACSTVDDRIAENADLYYSLSPEDQTNIKAGAVDVGFTKDMVYLALGQPDEVGRILRSGNEVEIWRYQDYSSSHYGHYGYYGYSHHYFHPYLGRGYYPFRGYYGSGFYGEPDREDEIVIEFVNGEVESVYYPDVRDYRPPLGRETQPPGDGQPARDAPASGEGRTEGLSSKAATEV